MKMDDLSFKRMNWEDKFQLKKTVAIRARYTKEEYLDVIQNRNIKQAMDTVELKKKRESALKKLETIE